MRELDDYLRAGTPAHWSVSADQLELESQVWKGIPWRHTVTVHGRGLGSTVILIVTGGEPNALDENEAAFLSQLAQMPVATLYHLPNQPLFDGLNEDDLIAFTFIQFLATGEADWPLLLPMVKSVVSAMDALQSTFEFEQFVVSGISKRGWTSWLAGASRDQRIVGIAPMAIDHLNFPKQMAHQLATWGAYSEQIRAYTELDLPKQLDSPEGLHLNAIVDPHAYTDAYEVPILVVNGTNDPYWQVDALSLYWEDLKIPKWARILPNAGHTLDKMEKNSVLAAFSRRAAHGLPIEAPRGSWVHRDSDTTFLPERIADAKTCRLWGAFSEGYEFRDKPWCVVAEGSGELSIKRPEEGLLALMAEWRFEGEGLAYGLTTPIVVLDRLGQRSPN